YRGHFRLLRDGLAQWMAGVVSPKGMPSYTEFVAGITDVLDHIRTTHTGNVLLVSSGGPISTAVGHVLGTSPETTIELNLRIRNCSLTEFAFNPKRHMLVTYNTLPHLDAPEHASWVTYA
ncbi:MAG: histidine phosphatase family protein, partial [Polaromonas sp.]